MGEMAKFIFEFDGHARYSKSIILGGGSRMNTQKVAITIPKE